MLGLPPISNKTMTPHYIHIHRKILPAPPFESASILRDLGGNADCQDKSWWWVAGLMVKWHAGQVCLGIWYIAEKGTLKQAGNYTLWPNHVSIQKILPDRWNPCNAFQTWHWRWRVTGDGKWDLLFHPFSCAQQSLKEIEIFTMYISDVTSFSGPKAVESYQDVRLRLSKWSQDLLQDCLLQGLIFLSLFNSKMDYM